MADIFVDYSTRICSDWLNNVDWAVSDALGNPRSPQEVLDNIGGQNRSVETAQDLRDFQVPDPLVPMTMNTMGALSVGDAGGGGWVWTPGDTTPDNLGTVLAPTGGGTGRWKRAYTGALTPQMFGVYTGAGDVTTALQACFDAAVNKVVNLSSNAQYSVTALTIRDNTQIQANGATINKIAASATACVTVGANVTWDDVKIVVPGGNTNDKALHISGSGFNAQTITLTATAETTVGGSNGVVGMSIGDGVTAVDGVIVGRFSATKFALALHLSRVTFARFDSALIYNYRTGVHLNDVAYSNFSNFLLRVTGASVNGSDQENGLLFTSTNSQGWAHDVRFTNWVVELAGGHAFNFTGDYAIYNIEMNRCRSIGSGSAIVKAHPSATAYYYGSGFKVASYAAALGREHNSFSFNSCLVEDVNATWGTFPSGHQQAGFDGFWLRGVKNFQINDCTVKRRTNATYSCNAAVSLMACSDVYVNGMVATDAVIPVEAVETATVGTTPGFDRPCAFIEFVGCRLGAYAASVGHIFNLFSTAQRQAHENFHIRACHLYKGNAAINLATITGGGSYTNFFFEFTRTDAFYGPANASADPVVVGDSSALINVRSQWTTASTPAEVSCKNGSLFQDFSAGLVRLKQNGVWAAPTT